MSYSPVCRALERSSLCCPLRQSSLFGSERGGCSIERVSHSLTVAHTTLIHPGYKFEESQQRLLTD